METMRQENKPEWRESTVDVKDSSCVRTAMFAVKRSFHLASLRPSSHLLYPQL